MTVYVACFHQTLPSPLRPLHISPAECVAGGWPGVSRDVLPTTVKCLKTVKTLFASLQNGTYVSNILARHDLCHTSWWNNRTPRLAIDFEGFLLSAKGAQPVELPEDSMLFAMKRSMKQLTNTLHSLAIHGDRWVGMNPKRWRSDMNSPCWLGISESMVTFLIINPAEFSRGQNGKCGWKDQKKIQKTQTSNSKKIASRYLENQTHSNPRFWPQKKTKTRPPSSRSLLLIHGLLWHQQSMKNCQEPSLGLLVCSPFFVTGDWSVLRACVVCFSHFVMVLY